MVKRVVSICACLAVGLPHVLVVPRNSTVSSVRDLVARAKAAPKKLTYSSSGVGTPVHLGGALFASMAGIELVHVPYKGAAERSDRGIESLSHRIARLRRRLPGNRPL